MIGVKTHCKNIEQKLVERKTHRAVYIRMLMEVLRSCFVVFFKKLYKVDKLILNPKFVS